MAIRSHAFGRVTLTKADATKFQSQVTYGRPKAAAVTNVQHGVQLARDFYASGGKLKVTLPRAK
jgi:hypothetical protein